MTLLQEKLSKFTAPQETKARGVYPYFRQIESDQDTEVIMDGRKVLMFGSNAYTGLTNHPKVKAAAIAMTEKYGTGCAGSRFLNGTLDIHQQLEERLAKFVGKEDCMVFSTGFFANLGTVGCLTGRQDYIIYDELAHASIIEGIKVSLSTHLKFRHNDMQSLEKMLTKCEPDRVKLIVVDGVYSMEGDVCNLPEIVRLAKQYGASVMVDEAHGIGVFGAQGRGVCDHFGLTDQVDIIMGTFSKSLASIGGFIATDKITANWLRHNSRPFIFSASATPAAIGAVNAALDILESEPERMEKLWAVTNHALEGFRAMGCEIGNTSTPIIPLYIRDFEKTLLVTKMLLDEGIFVNPVVPPAVPSGDTLIRFSLMATHTVEQVDFALEKIEKVFKSVGIL
ncbi:MAG: pyridoxal phosphate-dependent aminotransferase family protein [Bacteroidales bacterium]|jgi:8-amino-7-oxononanoate synthase|nr:pyridoxal phosphate-dependent aminotransferase family protein [Bacteroidales bacterium]